MPAASLSYSSVLPLPQRRLVELIRISSLRQLKARYRGSSLGVLWSFANPLMMTAIYTLIFGTAFASYYGGDISRYVFSAFVGVVIVTLFTQATSEALGAVVANGGLLNKIALDPVTFPLAAIAANTFQQSITTFPLMLLLSAFLTHDPIRVLLVPVVLVGVVALCTGVGLTLSALFVFFRDLSYVWGILSFVIWITCPVFYPVTFVPQGVRAGVAFNPVGLGIRALREVTLGHGPLDLRLVATFIVVALVIMVLGFAIFRSLRRDFMDLL